MAFIHAPFCKGSLDLLCHNRHFNIYTDNSQQTYNPAELKRLASWGEAFNRFLTTRMVKTKQMGDWASHFNNWLTGRDLNQDPSKINQHVTTAGNNATAKIGGGAHGASILAADRDYTGVKL
jgi:hypothetical protein